MERRTPIGEKQFRILMEINRKHDAEGYPPSIRELKSVAKLKSTSTVNYHVDKLVDYGYLDKRPGKSRAVKVLIEPCNANLDFDPNIAFSSEGPVVE